MFWQINVHVYIFMIGKRDASRKKNYEFFFTKKEQLMQCLGFYIEIYFGKRDA